MQIAIYKMEDDSQPVCLLQEGEYSLGRGEQLDCMDKRVSRNHVTIRINNSNATFTLNHQINPCYWQCAGSTHVSLLKPNTPQTISSGDKFGFFPGSFWFVIIKHQPDDNEPATITTVAVPDPKPSAEEQPANTHESENNQRNVTTDSETPNNDDTEPQATKVSSTADDNQPSCSNTTSTTSKVYRERCRFGGICYRHNLEHKKEYSHPGDPDYDTDPEDTRPACPYGRGCFRRNKLHRKDYKHSDQAAAKINGSNTTNNKRGADSIKKDHEVMKKKQKKQLQPDYSDDEDSEEEDPFFTDEDEDYLPSDSD